jgi:N-acetylglucosaminyldiphosphoundecaprenol N-acetyl-beta-D-mannosaminyltransferase
MMTETATHRGYKAPNKGTSVMSRRSTVSILGIRIHNIGALETTDRLEEMAMSSEPHHVVTINPEYVMIAQQNREFRQVLNDADLALPDGAGLLWASRVVGRPLQARVTGIDTVEAFAARAARRGFRLFLLGAADGVAEKAARRLQQKYPGLIIAGTYSGSPSADEEEEICERILAAKTNVLLVAYGAPRQDLWIARNLKRLGVQVAMGIGGTLDFIAGVSIRAPRWMREHDLEWLYRLIREPYRWRRMLTLPKFVVAVLQEKRMRRVGL